MRSKRHDNDFKLILLDLIVGLTLIFLAIGVGRQARASEMDDFVNAKIKEEFIKQDVEQLRLTMELPLPHPDEDLQILPQAPIPMKSRNPLLDRLDPTTVGEQYGREDRPQAGLAQKLDPSNPVEERIAEKQAYDLYRDHYRGAVQREFILRLRRAGYTTDRNIAEEIKAKEDARPH